MAIALILPWQPVPAQQAGAEGLDWRYRPEAHEVAVWDAPAENAPPSAPEHCEEPAPVVLPQPEFPDRPETGVIRGWSFKEPSLGTGGRVASYEEDRAAVQIAETRQQEQMAESVEPAPGIDELPGPLGDFNYRVDFGVEYRF